MKRHKFSGFFCFFFLGLQAVAYAQFYAPETEYHDKVQRLFVTELVRVLASRENSRSIHIQDIAYTVSNDVKQVTFWHVRLMDPQGKRIQEINVDYPESLLMQGPEFYRQVFKQVWTQYRWTPLPAGPPSEGFQGVFWEGAEQAGISREEGLRAAFKLVGGKPAVPEQEYIPKLGGLLAHIALPSLSGGLTLDAMVLSRAAAWLAVAESMGQDTARRDELWAPIIFLAGRERPACQLWKQSVGARQQRQPSPTLFEFWDFFLRNPSAKEAFLFATDRKQRPHCMGMLIYYARVQGVNSVLADLIQPLYADRSRTLLRLHNYAHYVSYTGVGGGRILEGAWPVLFRSDWLKTLQAFPLSPLDYTGHLAELKRVGEPKLSRAEEADSSLGGLKEMAPLLELGYAQGEGRLIPVSTVTVRDLLNYGWEMNGLQMGARHAFVDETWGVHDLADAIFKGATRDIQGQTPFFIHKFQETAYNLQTNLYRLQMVDDLFWRRLVDVHPFAKNLASTNAARLFHKRCWLRPYEAPWQAWALCKADVSEEIVPLIQTYHRESGAKADVFLLEFVNWWFNDQTIQKVKGLVDLKQTLIKDSPNPVTATWYAIEAAAKSKPPIFLAQEYEKLFWDHPDSGLANNVFLNYLEAGAWKSAKRFYRQVREVIDRDVAFSNTLGDECWVLAYLEGDKDLMELALSDSDSGSSVAMMTAFWDEIVHDDFQAAERQLDEMVERYESRKGAKSTARVLKGFMPLIPALKNARHPDHEKALDYFGKESTGSILRWILIRKFNLSTQDAVRFLGGQDAGGVQRICVLYLLKDANGLEAAYPDFRERQTSRSSSVLGAYLRAELIKKPLEAEEKDLKPPGAVSITRAVLEKLGKN